jgi:hypothetical protein
VHCTSFRSNRTKEKRSYILSLNLHYFTTSHSLAKGRKENVVIFCRQNFHYLTESHSVAPGRKENVMFYRQKPHYFIAHHSVTLGRKENAVTFLFASDLRYLTTCYQSSFRESCVHRAYPRVFVFQNGTYACASLCPQEYISPQGSCRHPRLVELPGQCCREWMCDSAAGQCLFETDLGSCPVTAFSLY